MYKNILFSTDGSELATQGLSHGLELARRTFLETTFDVRYVGVKRKSFEARKFFRC